MSATKAIIGTAAILALIGIGTAVHELQIASGARASLAELTLRLEAERAHLVALRQSSRNSPLGLRSTGPSVGLPASVPSAALAREFMAKYPGARSAFVDYVKRMDAIYLSRFFRDAGLTKDQEERFLASDAAQCAETIKLSPDGMMPGQPQRIEYVRQNLGEAAAQTYLRVQQLAPETAFMASNAAVVAAAGEPLTEQQRDAFLNLIQSVGPLPDAGHPVALTAVDWNAVQQISEAILSPTQAEILEPAFYLQAYRSAVLNAAEVEKNPAAAKAVLRQ